MPFGHMALPVRQFPGSYTSKCELSVLDLLILKLLLLHYLGFLGSKIAKQKQLLQWSSGYDIRLTTNVRREGSRVQSSVAVLFLPCASGLGLVVVGVVMDAVQMAAI